MDPAERRRFALAVIGAMLIVFCAALFLMFLDGKVFGSKDTESNAARRTVRIGDTRTFSVFDYSLGKQVELNMVCSAISEHSIIYREPTVDASKTLLKRVTAEFDDSIYPANREQFFATSIMGLVNEDKIIMLFLKGQRGQPTDMKSPAVAGYYSQDNEKLRTYKSESNEARIIHIFIGNYFINEDAVVETVAHETRHLKNWNITKNNIGLIIGSLFAAATVLTLYVVLSNLYIRTFAG